MSNFLFGYHIGVMNGPIVSVARELGFEGNSFLEGLVVSIFICGVFIGSIFSGSVVDKIGCRHTFQIDTIPLILGAIISAQAHSLDEVLLGRFLVGLGIGVNTVLVPIYISEVAPTKYRGTLGTMSQIGTSLGIIASLFLGIPEEHDPHWWRIMLYIASVPGFILPLGMQFAVDSPLWLGKAGRLDDAAEVIRNLWGSSEISKAVEEFQSIIRDDGADMDTSWLELLREPHPRVAFYWRYSFSTSTVFWSKWCALFFVLNFSGGWNCKLCLSEVIHWAHELCRCFLCFILRGYAGETKSSNWKLFGNAGAGPLTGMIIPELSRSKKRGKSWASVSLFIGYAISRRGCFSLCWWKNSASLEYMQALVGFPCWQQHLLIILQLKLKEDPLKKSRHR